MDQETGWSKGLEASASPKPSVVSEADRKRALFGSGIGSTIEWYDYFLYGTMSATVFGKLFFPSSDPVTSQLLALASFALAFLIRPLGGIFFSHIGDKIGRKKTLFATLALMGLSTVAMGLLPTYSQIGVWAPILLTLLRLLQGIALGGEWGGGLLLAVEYAPPEKRGFYGAVPGIGAMLGLALGNFITVGLSAAFGEDAFYGYAWRIPFIASIVLLFVGLWIRLRIDETPAFKAMAASGKRKRVPLIETLTKHRRAVLIVIGTKFVETSTFFFFATFTITYLVDLGYQRVTALNMVLVAALAAVPAMLFFGALSDRIGRKRQFIAGSIAMAIYILPYFWLLQMGSAPIALFALVLGFSVIFTSYGTLLGTFFAEAFPADVRYTGVSLGYQVGAALVGGPLPLVASSLLAYSSGNYYSIAALIAVCAAISCFAIGAAEDKTGRDLS